MKKIDPSYKNDLRPENERRVVCERCGADAKVRIDRAYFCASCWRKPPPELPRHKRGAVTHLPSCDQSPVELAPADVIGALAANTIRGSTAADILQRLEERQ